MRLLREVWVCYRGCGIDGTPLVSERFNAPPKEKWATAVCCFAFLLGVKRGGRPKCFLMPLHALVLV